MNIDTTQIWNGLKETERKILVTASRHKKTAILKRDAHETDVARQLANSRLLVVFRYDEHQTVYNITDLGREVVASKPA